MTVLRQNDERARKAVRKTRWLPALEQELKSRVGWVDEAVSPFAVERRAVQTAAKIQRDAVPPKAA
jgi:transcription initiation factor TFIIIB Brf1 subunit/transcription initiation factor TFIIB